MKPKVLQGCDARGLLRYLTRADKNAEFVAGSIDIPAAGLAVAAREFTSVAALRPDVKAPILHFSLSLPPPERLALDRWGEASERFLRKLGLDPETHAWAAYRHHDRAHDHVHLTVTRNDLSGTLWNDGRSILRAIRAAQEIEIEMNLQRTPGLGSDATRRRNPSPGELGLARSTGQVPTRIGLQRATDAALAGSKSFPDFVERLTAAGVQLLPNGHTGTVSGLSYRLLDHSPGQASTYKGSSLGRAYSWKYIAAKTNFDSERDAALIASLRAAAQALQQADEDAAKDLVIAPVVTTRTDPKPRRRTLDLAFQQRNDNWLWKSRERVAFVDAGDAIRFKTLNPTALKAGLQLARQKGWTSIVITGSEQARRELWRQARLLGYTADQVHGYEPTEAERLAVEREIYELEVKRNERRNGRESTEPSRPGVERTSDATQGFAGGDPADGSRTNRATGAVTDYRGQGDGRPFGRGDGGIDGNEADPGPESPGIGGGEKTIGREQRQFGIPGTADRGDVENSTRDEVGAARSRDAKRPVNGDTQVALAAAVHEMSDLAAPAAGGRPIPADWRAKIDAIRQATAVFGSQAGYRITLTPRREHDRHGRPLVEQVIGNRGRPFEVVTDAKGQRKRRYKSLERLFSAREIEALIPRLRRDNASGYDIYVTPISSMRHFLVIDDISAEKLAALRAAGYQPCLVQQSSADNFQAIIAVPAVVPDDAKTRKIFNRLVQALNQRYGDPGLQGVIHPFRLTGFVNKKAEKETQPNFGEITRIVASAPGRICPLAVGLIERRRHLYKFLVQLQLEAERAQGIGIGPHPVPTEIAGSGAASAFLDLRKKHIGLARAKGWKIDESAIDYRAARDLLRAGWPLDGVHAAILASPAVGDRHHDPDDYARRTVKAAAAALARHATPVAAKPVPAADRDFDLNL